MHTPVYDQLYIYEVLGDARAWARDLGPSYLGLWLEGDTSFMFFGQPSDQAMERLVAASGLSVREQHRMTYQEWQGGLEMEPLILQGLAVVPAWHEGPLPDDRPLLRLDPGLVFGNGLHPTTRHCLELLAMLAKERPLGAVSDLGCGTGILGLAACLLGAVPVLAVDLNPLCVTTTANNAKLNGLEIEVVEGSAADFAARPAHTLLANVHLAVQRAILAQSEALADKQDLILSGLMRSDQGPVEDLVLGLGYRIRERREADSTWFTLWGGEPPPP